MTSNNQELSPDKMSQGVMSIGEGTRIFPDIEACIDCGACVVSCKRTWDIPRDEQRIGVVNMFEGQPADPMQYNRDSGGAIKENAFPGESNLPMQCYHCDNAPCVSVCPVDSLVKKENRFVEVREDLCIGCQYCLSGCPFGAPNFPKSNEGKAALFGSGGTMDKCTMCEERQNVGKGPACAEECSTDALLVGTTDQIASELEQREVDPFFNEAALEIIFGKEEAEAFK